MQKTRVRKVYNLNSAERDSSRQRQARPTVYAETSTFGGQPLHEYLREADLHMALTMWQHMEQEAMPASIATLDQLAALCLQRLPFRAHCEQEFHVCSGEVMLQLP